MQYTDFIKYSKLFTRLSELKLKFDITFPYDYLPGTGGKDYRMVAEFTDLQNVITLSRICEVTNGLVDICSLESSVREGLGELTPCEDIMYAYKQHRHPDSLKYFAPNCAKSIDPVIMSHVQENVVEGITTRIIVIGNQLFCVTPSHPAFNYMDVGHSIFFSQSNKWKEGFVLIINQMTLDTCFIAAMFELAPEYVTQNATNEVFISAQTARQTLMKLEKGLPPRYQTDWLQAKNVILKDFKANAQNVMVSKLLNQEVKKTKISNIDFTTDTATYENISITASNLATTVFDLVNPNEVFDIYAVIDTYIAWLEKLINATGMGDHGFRESKQYEFSINGINIVVSIGTTHTRRKINGKYVKKDELAKVLRHASCLHTQDDFDNFVKSVERQSLDVHNVVSGGLPIRIIPFTGRDYYPKSADVHWPKLQFKKLKNKYNLVLDDEAQTTMPMKSFVGFIEKIRKINKKIDNCDIYTYRDNAYAYITRNTEWGVAQIKATIRSHLASENVADEQLTLISDTTLNKMIEDAKLIHERAEAKSEQLLQESLVMLKAEKLEWSAPGQPLKPGYKVNGQQRTYWVDEETAACWCMDPLEYVCIVDGGGEQGVGKDRVVARLFALKNDVRMASTIHTLMKHVTT